MRGLVQWDQFEWQWPKVAWGAPPGRRVYNRAVSRVYSLQDADDMVPGMAVIVQRLRDFRDEVIAIRDAERLRAAALVAEGDGAPADDPELLRLRLRTRGLVDQMQADAAWLDERDIILRDISTGLLDFPGESNGQPIWLCWRLGEPAVTAWHPRDEGFAGRRPVAELG
jgi:hypothetical protein